jgi:uncharacterized protein (DUF2267 family)
MQVVLLCFVFVWQLVWAGILDRLAGNKERRGKNQLVIVLDAYYTQLPDAIVSTHRRGFDDFVSLIRVYLLPSKCKREG